MSEGEVAKFQELVLRSRGARDEVALCEAEEGEGLGPSTWSAGNSCFRDQSYHDLSSRNRKKFCVPEEIRGLACDAANCRDPVRRRRLRKFAMRARREFEAGKAVLPRGKVINRPVITKLWVNGRANEGRDEWREEVRAHCERCNDDKEETSEVQAERILSQRRRRDPCVALQGVGKCSGTKPMDQPIAGWRKCCNVSRRRLVTRWQTGSTSVSEESVVPWRRGRFYASCSSKKTWRQTWERPAWVSRDRTIERVLHMVRDRLGGHCCTRKRSRLNGDACTLERKGGELWAHAGLGDEHISTTLGVAGRQTHWSAAEGFRYNTAFMTSLDVKTAFDVAEPSVVSKILTRTGVHGHLTAALLAEMQDVWGSASFENCETEFRYSRCIRQGGVEAPVVWRRTAKHVLWKAKEKRRAQGWGLSFGGQHDNEHALRGMMWADNYWLFSDNREK